MIAGQRQISVMELDDGSELTRIVERLPELEKLAGVKIDGICAVRDGFGNALGHTTVSVMAQVTSFIGHVLPGTVTIQIVCYNDRDQVVGLGQEYLYQTSYRGFQAFRSTVHCRAEPVRIVIAPRAS